MKIEEVKSTIMGTISIESVNFGQTIVDACMTNDSQLDIFLYFPSLSMSTNMGRF